jgi:cytoskeletal protein CcmA (bactofilin family)
MLATNEARTGPSETASFSSAGHARVAAYLGPSMKIKGQITGDEDLRVDGKIEGPISLGNHRLTAGPNSSIRGEIVSREIVIYGDVKGNLRAHDRIEIKKEGSVIGKLQTARITIEDGAYFKGAIGIEHRSTKGSTDPETRLAVAEKDFKLKSVRAAGTGQ